MVVSVLLVSAFFLKKCPFVNGRFRKRAFGQTGIFQENGHFLAKREKKNLCRRLEMVVASIDRVYYKLCACIPANCACFFSARTFVARKTFSSNEMVSTGVASIA